MTASAKVPLIPFVPRDFLIAPVFTATPQTKPRTLVINSVKWTIGDEHPIKRHPAPALDMRHGRACFTLLSFRDRLKNERDIHFSMNEFCHRYAESQGGRYSRKMLSILFDLHETWIRRELPDGTSTQFSVIGDIEVTKKPLRRRDALRAGQRELWLDRVSLSPHFFALLQDWERLVPFRLDVLNSMSSPTAQAIYAFLPSRAIHHTKDNPFAVRLTTLLEQIGADVPSKKSDRKRRFTKNANSIFSQLNGAALINNTLRIDFADTKDGTDYNLLAWVEPPHTLRAPTPKESKVLAVWLESGKTKEEFNKRVKKAQLISSYAEDLLQQAKVTLDGNHRFFEIACALLGEDRFNAVLAEAKRDALEGDPGQNPTGRLIYRLTEALKG